MRILILNGPNLNLTGTREKEVYGYASYEMLCKHILQTAKSFNIDVSIQQSNHEGVLIDALHKAHEDNLDGVILNAGALSHYSYALRDAVAAINVSVIEVHLSDLKQRKEAFRHHSVLHDVCVKTFMGRGFESYSDALNYFHSHRHDG